MSQSCLDRSNVTPEKCATEMKLGKTRRDKGQTTPGLSFQGKCDMNDFECTCAGGKMHYLWRWHFKTCPSAKDQLSAGTVC